MPYDKNHGTVTRMYDRKGKPTGLMMEGSVNHMQSLLHHSGKSKMHAKPEKEMPDDGHTHYEKVEGQKARKLVKSPDASETNKLSDTSGGVGQMSPYKLHGDPDTPHTDPELTKKEGKAKTSVSTSGDTTTTTTTQRMSGTGETGGFASGTGYDLNEVIVGLYRDSSSTTNTQTNKQKRQAKRAARKKERKNTYSKTGMAIQTLGTFLPGGGGKYRRRQLEKTARKGLF